MKKSKILITDEQPDVGAVDAHFDAEAKKDARCQTLTKWLLGHACDVLQDNNPNIVTITVGEQRFLDRRSEHPSEQLIAQLTLAIYAGEGLSPSKFDIQDLSDETVHEVLTRGVSRPHTLATMTKFAYRGGNRP